MKPKPSSVQYLNLVLTKHQMRNMLTQVVWCLEEAIAKADPQSAPRRLPMLLKEAEATRDAFQRHFGLRSLPARDRGFEKFLALLTKSSKVPTHTLVSWAFSEAGGAASAETKGFTMPPALQHKIKELAGHLLRCVHEMRKSKRGR